MHKPISISELLKSGGHRVTAIQAKSLQRTAVLDQVRSALPTALGNAVVSAGIEAGRLTVGVTIASWAVRLRYETHTLRQRVGATLGMDIHSVRIRVVPPRT